VSSVFKRKFTDVKETTDKIRQLFFACIKNHRDAHAIEDMKVSFDCDASEMVVQ